MPDRIQITDGETICITKQPDGWSVFKKTNDGAMVSKIPAHHQLTFEDAVTTARKIFAVD